MQNFAFFVYLKFLRDMLGQSVFLLFLGVIEVPATLSMSNYGAPGLASLKKYYTVEPCIDKLSTYLSSKGIKICGTNTENNSIIFYCKNDSSLDDLWEIIYKDELLEQLKEEDIVGLEKIEMEMLEYLAVKNEMIKMGKF